MEFTLSALPLPTRLRPQSPWTDEDLLRFCAANEGLRVERDPNGELIVMSPAGSQSSGRNMDISTDLNIWARSDGRGKAFDSSGGFTLPDGSMRSPDAAWILLSRWNGLTPEQQRRFAPICPDFVLELRSPTDNLSELEAKMGHWIANGVQLGWLIDPETRTVTIYSQDSAPEEHQDPTSVQGRGIIAGFELITTRIWS